MHTGHREVLITASVMHLVGVSMHEPMSRKGVDRSNIPITENMATHAGRDIVARIREANSTMEGIRFRGLRGRRNDWCNRGRYCRLDGCREGRVL